MTSNSTVSAIPTVPANARILPAQNQIWRPPPQETALPLRVQSLERALDVGIFISQVDKLLSTPVETLAMVNESTSVQNRQGPQSSKKSLLSTKCIWEDDQARKRDLSCLYNFSTLGKRKWLKNVLLEESDSDSDTETTITERDLKILLKIHKYRRKYQKRYHTDILNSQYTYYGAGLLSEHDRFPEHKKFILSEYGFTIPSLLPPLHTPSATNTVCPVSPAKRLPVKRRRDSQRSSTIDGHNKSIQGPQSVNSIGGEPCSTGNGHPSSSSELNSPMSSPSPYPYFAVPLVKVPGAAYSSSLVIDAKSTATVSATVPSLARPFVDPGDVAGTASRWRAWRAIAVEDIPKAYTERIIQRKYQSVVLKQIALYCAQFLEQAREAAVSGKSKTGKGHGKKNHGGNWHGVGLRPVSKQVQGSTSK